MTIDIVAPYETEKSLADSEFRGWLVKAAPGDAFEYYRGYLARDIDAHASRLSEYERVALARLARWVWRAGEQNLVHLVQRRHGPHDYTYLAIVRSKPRKALASLSPQLLAEVE